MEKLNLNDLLKAGECCATPNLKPKERCGSCPMKDYVIEQEGLVCADELVLQLCDALRHEHWQADRAFEELIKSLNVRESTSQDDDFRWFLEHYQDLFEEYGECYLVIQNHKILGAYFSYEDAVRATVETSETLGAFIVQECNGKEDANSAYIAML